MTVEDNNWRIVKEFMAKDDMEKLITGKVIVENKEKFMDRLSKYYKTQKLNNIKKDMRSLKIRLIEFYKKPETQELVKRLKGFLWSGSMMILAGLIDICLQYLIEYNTNNETIIILGLILGQVSKYLNNKYGSKR